MADNTRVDFMYRDASNYKCHKYEIFAGPPTKALVSRLLDAVGVEHNPDEITLPLEGWALDQSQFNPDQVGLLNLRREEMAGHYDDDTDLHEITGVRATSEAVRYDPRTFEEFVRDCESVDEWHRDTEQWEAENSPHVQITGDPVEGFSAYGPFPSKAEALAFMYEERKAQGTPVWAMPLHNPAS